LFNLGDFWNTVNRVVKTKNNYMLPVVFARDSSKEKAQTPKPEQSVTNAGLSDLPF
jgi:hypothetical protein